MWHVFLQYFGIPNGAVWSNILAEPIIFGLTVLLVYPFRNHMMRKFVAFHHKHKTEHEARLKKDDND